MSRKAKTTHGRAARMLLAAACAALAPSSPARAADTWTNAAGDDAWRIPGNWADNTVPASTDAVTFPAPGPASRTVLLPFSSNATAQSLTFNSNYTLDGGRLDLVGAPMPVGASITVASNVTATINSEVASTTGLTKSGPGTLVLNGPAILNQNSNLNIDAGTLVVRSDASLSGQFGRNYTRGTLVIDGTFSTNKRFEPSNGTIHVTAGNTFTLAGNDQLGFSPNDTWTKAGEGTLVALGHTSRFGVTHLDAGTIRLEGDLGYGPVSVRGGTLELAPRFGGFYPNELRIAAGSTGRVQSARGTITINNLTMAAGADVFPTFAGATPADALIVRTLPFASPASIITVAGEGRVEVQQSSPYVGGWNVISGTLRGNSSTLGPGASPVTVSGTGTLLVQNGPLNRALHLNDGATLLADAPVTGPVRIGDGAVVRMGALIPAMNINLRSGELSGGSNATIHIDGPGGIAVAGTNEYAGHWVVHDGRLRVESPDALGSETSPVIVNAGGTLNLHAMIARPVQLNDGATLSGGGSGLGGGGGGVSRTVTLAPAASVSLNGTLLLAGAPSALTGGGSGAVLRVGGAGTVRLTQPSDVAADWIIGNAHLVLSDDAQIGAPTNTITLDGPFASLITDAPVTSARDLIVNRGTFETQGHESRFANLRGSGAEAGVFTKSGPGTLRVKHIRLQSLDVFGGRLSIEPGAPVSRLGELTIQTEASLDLNDNDLIIDATPETRDAVLRDVHNLIATARNTIPRWREGLTSSAAATDPLTTLAAVLNPGLATFSGEEINENAVIIKYTYNGDANVDGRVNADDYFRIDQGFLAQPANPAYAQGDFNYDGAINADDYFLIDQAFLGQGTPLTGSDSERPLSATAAIPEPTAFLPLAGLLFGLHRPRNRCHKPLHIS